MMTFSEPASAASDLPEPFTDRLRLTVAAYLARFKGSSRAHTESDPRCYLSWCAERGLDPLAAQRPHLELCIRWMQEIRRFKPSTVSRRFSVTPGSTGPPSSTASCNTHPPSTSAPRCPPNHPRSGSPTCSSRRCSPPPGNHLTRRTSRSWPCSACWACGSSKLPANIADLGEEHGHRVLRGVQAQQGGPVSLPPAVGRAIDRAAGLRDGGPILLNRRGTRMDRHAAIRRLRHLAGTAGLRAKVHPHMLRHTSPRCSMLVSTCGMSRSPPVTLTRARLCATPERARTNLDRHPNYILAAYMSSAT
jgi:integrase/recombinase XerD